MVKSRCVSTSPLVFLVLLSISALLPPRGARAEDLLDTLQKKGVLTEEETKALREEQQKSEGWLSPQEARAVEEEQEKRDTVTEAKLALLKGLEGVSIGALGYVDYSYGRKADTYTNAFGLTRGYINIKKDIASWLSVRITPDVVLRTGEVKVTSASVDPETGKPITATGKDPQSGDIELRLKYYYAQFNVPDYWIFAKTKSEVGMGHIAWLDFEESVTPYRCQGTMFQERAGLFDSADLGINLQGYLGGEMPDDYKKTVNKSYAGRYGSYHLGVVNGSGYHASEANKNKAVQYRLTLRPMPEILPGLQLTYFGLTGRGNQSKDPPNWVDHTGFASYQHEYFTGTFEYCRGTGNQKGTLVDASGRVSDASGWSIFGFFRMPLWKDLRAFGRYDVFDPNGDKSTDGYRLAMGGLSYDVKDENMAVLDGEVTSYDKNFGKDNASRRDDWKIQAIYQISY